MANKDNRLLTPLELKVMKLLWERENAFVKDLLEHWDTSDDTEKPAYNTVSTIVRILENKDLVGHKAYGRTHEYFPIMTEDEYHEIFLENALETVFSGSVGTLWQKLLGNKNIDEKELAKLKKLVDNQ